jgi:hypothetical protein
MAVTGTAAANAHHNKMDFILTFLGHDNGPMDPASVGRTAIGQQQQSSLNWKDRSVCTLPNYSRMTLVRHPRVDARIAVALRVRFGSTARRD